MMIWSTGNILKLKSKKCFRLLMFPYIAWYRYKLKMRYEDLELEKKICRYKNRFADKRCFVIGNGPSLTVSDLELLNGELCFGTNAIYELFDKTSWKPFFYVCIDPEVLKECCREICRLNIEHIFLVFQGRVLQEKINYLLLNHHFVLNKYGYHLRKVEENPAKGISMAHSVSITCLELAIYMGFKEIYLLGMDHENPSSHAKGMHQREQFETAFKQIKMQEITRDFTLIREYAESKGVRIVNVTRGGNLQVFPKKELEAILSAK